MRWLNEMVPPTVSSTQAAPGLPSGPARYDWFGIMLKSAIALFLVAVAALVWEDPSFAKVLTRRPPINVSGGALSSAAVGLTRLLSLFFGVLILFRSALWIRYRPVEPRPDLPKLSIIVPAYNEGPMIADSIQAILAADYPPGLVEVICIDDGSTDNTWERLAAMQAAHPGRVTAIRFPTNRGKRQALFAGFQAAQGEVLVTVDSDSLIEPSALRALVAPLQADPQVGAVAGKVRVLNRRESLITRMLTVVYILAFDYIRASQSTFMTVICCPGALSAYRRTVIAPILDEWLHQDFLGVRCTYGEDRSLTNFVLQARYYCVYQQSAVVHTLVPATYGRLCRMYLRWQRSNIRESLRLGTFLFTRCRSRYRVLAIVDFFFINGRLILQPVGTLLSLFVLVSSPSYLVPFIAGIAIAATASMVYYIRTERDSDCFYWILYAYFSLIALVWVPVAAALTLRHQSWMTR